ncbi:MAG: hypothetical protein DRN71_05505 [Candidatus Nanohalarchaeota archaeon]|nr:MAG: hypothetical protein DRN71_05505 [Candidatus Nanohaloarchaeota archaeon]
MKEKEKRAMNIREKDNRSLPNLPFSSKKSGSEGQRHSSVMLKKNETLAKTKGLGGLMKDKIAHIFGVKEIVSKPEEIECKVPPGNELRKRQSQDIDSNFSEVSKQLKTPDETIKYPEIQKRTRVAAVDINSVSVRLSDLEEHVMDMHSAFDDFVLQADQYMNYEQFIEVRKEIEDKMKMLDNIEKSLNDSKAQILKDSGYMDSILGGFKYTKKRIDILEKRLDVMSKSDNSSSGALTLRKLVSPFGWEDGKQKVDSSKLSSLDKTVSELKNQMDNLKQREYDVQREVEKLKKKKDVFGKDNDLSENMKLFRNDIDGLKEKISHYSDSREQDMIKRQISEFGARLDKLDKRYSKYARPISKNGGKDNLHAGIFGKFFSGGAQVPGGKGTDKRVSALCKQVEDIRKRDKKACREVESLREKMASLDNIHNQMDDLLAKVGEGSVDEVKLKKEIVKGIDVDEMVKRAVDAKVEEWKEGQDSEIVAEANRRIDAVEEKMKSVSKNKDADKACEELERNMVSRKSLQGVEKRVDEVYKRVDEMSMGQVGRTEIAVFGKRQDELKKEIAMLKKDIWGMSGMQDSMEQIRAVVNNLRKDIKKGADEKILQYNNSGRRDDDLAEIRGNIERLKTISQEL